MLGPNIEKGDPSIWHQNHPSVVDWQLSKDRAVIARWLIISSTDHFAKIIYVGGCYLVVVEDPEGQQHAKIALEAVRSAIGEIPRNIKHKVG